jgi:hypothetical protein
VNEQLLAQAHVDGRNHERLLPAHQANMAKQRFIQDRVDLLSVLVGAQECDELACDRWGLGFCSLERAQITPAEAPSNGDRLAPWISAGYVVKGLLVTALVLMSGGFAACSPSSDEAANTDRTEGGKTQPAPAKAEPTPGRAPPRLRRSSNCSRTRNDS